MNRSNHNRCGHVYEEKVIVARFKVKVIVPRFNVLKFSTLNSDKCSIGTQFEIGYKVKSGL